MTANEDTYVLPENSVELLAEVLPASDPLRLTWEVLSNEERAGFLSAALRRMENLRFIGKRVSYFQPLQFPRIARGIPPQFDDAPTEVKRAQVVWATEIVREELYLKRRNADACKTLGFIEDNEVTGESVPERVKELLHRWITRWRRI